MTIEELGQQIKAKHPRYSAFPDAVVANRAIAVNPRYRSLVDSPVSTGNSVSMAKAVMDVLPSIAPSPTQRIQSGLDTAGEKVAEVGGRMGYPKLGALYGTEIQTLPDILGAATSLGALETSQSPLARAIRMTPEEYNQAYRGVEAASGVENLPPIQRGAMARFPQPERIVPTKQPIPVAKAETLPAIAPESYPRDIPSLVRFANKRISTFGNKLSPNEVDSYRQIFTNTLDEMEKKGLSGSPIFAQVADLKTKAMGLLNSVVPGREDVSQAFALSKKLNVPIDAAKKLIKYGAAGAGTIFGAKGLIDYFKNQ